MSLTSLPMSNGVVDILGDEDMSSPDSFEDYNGENGSSFGDPKKKKGPAPRQQEGKSSKFEPQSLRYKYRHELILMPHFFLPLSYSFPRQSFMDNRHYVFRIVSCLW